MKSTMLFASVLVLISAIAMLFSAKKQEKVSGTSAYILLMAITALTALYMISKILGLWP